MPELTPEQEALLQEEMQRIEAERERAADLTRQQERGVEGLVAQIQSARRDIEASVSHLQDLCQQLRTAARQLSGEDGGHHYTVFTNAHLRLVGALTQGLRRTASMDRLLDAAKAEQEETQRRDDREREYREARDRQQAINRLQLPQDDDFEDLYGEVMSDA